MDIKRERERERARERERDREVVHSIREDTEKHVCVHTQPHWARAVCECVSLHMGGCHSIRHGTLCADTLGVQATARGQQEEHETHESILDLSLSHTHTHTHHH